MCPEYPEYYISVTRKNISSFLVHGHHYCRNNYKIDDGKFDSIDRLDESQVRAAQSPLDLNITLFTPCFFNDDSYIDGFNKSGVMCGLSCASSENWCRDDNLIFPCDSGSGIITSNDNALCQDPRVWANVTCILYFQGGGVKTHGLRCRGQNMRCIYPWYTWYSGEPSPYVLPQCPDKSDQVFNSSLTCKHHLQQHLDFHTEKFCNEKYPVLEDWKSVQSKLICSNKTQWLLSNKTFLGWTRYEPFDMNLYSDPHSCQSSCSDPGPACMACTNSSYFQCPQSGQCVHPDLVCDGHPQCIQGEDEDLSMCYEKYLIMKIVQPLAQLKCKSLFYENRYIYATPHNNKTECWNGFDEQETEEHSTTISVTSATCIIAIYIVLKYSGLAKKMLSTDNQYIVSTNEIDKNFHRNILDYIILKNYSENHDQNETIFKTNIHILNSIYTQKLYDKKEICDFFYELEQQIHQNNVSEIHLCLHKKMDPKVVENILKPGLPGYTITCIERFENLLVNRRFIMLLHNKITRSLIIKEIIGTTKGLIKIIAKSVDLFKDTALSIIMLQAVGGFESIWNFKTNFASVIVITMFSSILIPLFMSTLHLIVNRRKMIDENNFTRTRKYITITLCWMASFLNPIILDAYYHELKEDVRKLTQNYNIQAMTLLRKCKKIKNQIVTFHKLELGKYHM